MDRSQYLIQALQAMGQQPQGSAGGMAGNLGALALARFAQDRKQRDLANNLDPAEQSGPLSGGNGILRGIASLGKMWEF